MKQKNIPPNKVNQNYRHGFKCHNCSTPITINNKSGFCRHHRKYTEEHREKIRLRQTGDTNSFWGGDKISLTALHVWVTKRYPRKELCEKCLILPPIDLANKGIYYKGS